MNRAGFASIERALGAASRGDDPAIHGMAARRAGRRALEAADRLQSYREYIARARAFKIARGWVDAPDGAAREFEREVLGHAQSALADVRVMSVSAVQAVRTYLRSGALDARMVAYRRALEAAGPVSVTELWREAIAPGNGAQALDRIGLSDALVRAIGDGLDPLELRIDVDRTRLVLTGTIEGRVVTGSVATDPRPARPPGTAALLHGGRWEAVASALERGEPAYLDGVGLDLGRSLRTEDLALHAALHSVREGVRHARKLEDTGLATYQGREPGIIGFTLMGLVLLLGAWMAHDMCRAEDATAGDAAACWLSMLAFAGVWLVFGLAFFTLSGGFDPAAQPQGPVGSVVQRAVLKDLEEQPA